MSLEFLKKFDFFPKLNETVEIKKTTGGGIIFSAFSFLIGALILIEIYTFFLGDPIKQPYIENPDLEEKVRINVNISFHETPCESLTVDLQDVAGNSYEDLKHSIYKLDLDEKGYIIDAEKYKEAQKFEKKNFFPSYPFWERLTGRKETSCYGAELYEGQECRTCEDVLRAYRQRRWPAPMVETITQCKGVQVPKTVSMLPQIQIAQLPHIQVQAPRNLQQVNNFTEKPSIMQILHNQAPQFSFENTVFIVKQLKEQSMFSFNIARSQCQNPQDASLEFSYIDSVSGDVKKVKSDPIHFAGTQCKVYFPFKIDSVKGDELILQSFLIKGEKLHIKIKEDDEIFKVQITPLNTKQAEQNEPPTALFKRGSDFDVDPEQPSKTKGRMLHAEFYGFNDQRPTFITPHEVEFFKNKLGKGCQIVGTMFTKRVPGNFHISTHHKGLALTQIEKPITAQHKIHLLEFTKDDGKITLGTYAKASNFLDTTHLHPPIANDVHYYVKLIGSTSKHLLWGEHKFYEYVAYVDVVHDVRHKNIILVEFKYEFDPVSMRYISGRSSITHFIVSLLAIVGGIFATSSFIDNIASRFKS